MRFTTALVFLSVSVWMHAATGAQSPAAEKGGVDLTGPYEVARDWPKYPMFPDHEGWVPAPITAVYAESADRVFFVQRGELRLPDNIKPGPGAIYAMSGRTATSAINDARREHYVLVADREGHIKEAWTQWDSLWEGSRGPHHIKISPYDPEKHVWIIDDDLQQVLKFTNDGKQLVMSVGERLVAGNDAGHFGRPTDVAWLPDGTFFVTDGYINKRVVKFDKDGNYLLSWGREGSGPGEFNGSVHAIAIDDQRRLYVADRGNSRIQVFDENGRFLDAWPDIPDPWHVHVSRDQFVWVVDGRANKFLKYDRSGRLLDSWGSQGQFPGGLYGVHQFSVDNEGNLYTAEAFNGRIEKFVPRANANRERLIQPERTSR